MGTPRMRVRPARCLPSCRCFAGACARAGLDVCLFVCLRATRPFGSVRFRLVRPVSRVVHAIGRKREETDEREKSQIRVFVGPCAQPIVGRRVWPPRIGTRRRLIGRVWRPAAARALLRSLVRSFVSVSLCSASGRLEVSCRARNRRCAFGEAPASRASGSASSRGLSASGRQPEAAELAAIWRRPVRRRVFSSHTGGGRQAASGRRREARLGGAKAAARISAAGQKNFHAELVRGDS